MADKKRILFVCLGNIVRSPLAEHLFMHLAKEAGVAERYETDSAGTGAYHVGESPDSRMRSTAARRGLHYDGSARQFSSLDFDRFDLIIPMDMSNRNAILALAPDGEQREKIHLMREFDPQGGPQAAVPDPYYGGNRGFEEAYDLIERSCRGLLEKLERDAG